MSIRHRMKIKPYSLRDYRADAAQIIQGRLEDLKTDNYVDPEVNVVLSHIEKTGKIPFFEPEYGAKWSAISRKRKSGLLLLWLYYIADKESLDMTTVLAQRLLQGLAGCSISNRVLIESFGRSDRTAADKSQDWGQIDEIVKKYQDEVKASLSRNKNRLADIKSQLWLQVNKG